MTILLILTLIKQMNKKLPYIITGCLSAALFYIFYGFRILNPLYVDWLLTEGDPGQHYLGFALYRNSPFKFNFGLTNAVAYPFNTSVIFTDSIPLMAVPCKLIGKFTDAQFQYFGIWALLCFILMGVLSCYLLSRYIDDPVLLVLSSLLITISPCMLKRIFWHTSLGSHFLIIIGFILIAYRKELCDTLTRTMQWWALLGCLCSFVHIYFLAMDSILLAAFVCFSIFDHIMDTGSDDKKDYTRIFGCIGAPLSYSASAALSIWLLGGFSSGMENGAPGLSFYSFNLNGFINPQGWSAFLPDLALLTNGQYEGFAYLGLGMLLTTLISISAGIVKYLKVHKENPDLVKEKMIRKLPYMIVTFILFVFTVILSASNEPGIGSIKLLSVELPETIRKLWDIFRACGRLIWPAVYLICLCAVVILCRSVRRRAAIGILVLCILMQLTDLGNIIKEKHAKYDQRIVFEHRLKDDLINNILWEHNIKHIVFLDKNNLSQQELYSFAELAARRKLTINDFYFARSLKHPAKDAALDFFMHPSDDVLYVISDESYEMRYMFDLEYYKYGGLSLGLKPPQ